jgi:hypothetical protein
MIAPELSRSALGPTLPPCCKAVRRSSRITASLASDKAARPSSSEDGDPPANEITPGRVDTSNIQRMADRLTPAIRTARHSELVFDIASDTAKFACGEILYIIIYFED